MAQTKAVSSKAIGAPSSKASSRKSKASWRKAIDLSEVENHLESERAQERLIGKAPSSQKKGKQADQSATDAALFTIDTKGDEEVAARVRSSKAGKRPLKSLEILQSKSAVPAFSGRARPKQHTPAKQSEDAQQAAEDRLRKAGLSSKAAKDKLRRLANKTVRGPLGGILQSEQSRLQDVEGVQQLADHDIWSEPATVAGSKRKADGQPGAGAAEEEWVQEAKPKPVKIPKTLTVENSAAEKKQNVAGSKPTNHEVVQLSRSLPAVPLPHPGQSYNPDVESHEQLIQQAYELEKAKEIEEEALRRYKRQWDSLKPSEQEAVLKDKASKEYLGMQVDLPTGEASEDDEEDEGQNEKTEDAEGKKEPKRKTKAQRARAKRAKEEQREAQERKMLKKLRHLMTQIPALRKEWAAREKQRNEAAAAKRKEAEDKIKQRGMQGQKVGKNVVPGNVDLNADQVQLGEDLTENLRALKTEGNLFRDRFQRLQTRALAEPRVPVSSKRALGKKGRVEYETHSYKKFT